MTTVEVVPPAGPDTEPILTALESLAALSFDGFMEQLIWGITGERRSI